MVDFSLSLCCELSRSLLIRVLGPQLITACVDHNVTIPCSSYPLYSLAMQSLTICCTNLPHTDRVGRPSVWTRDRRDG